MKVKPSLHKYFNYAFIIFLLVLCMQEKSIASTVTTKALDYISQPWDPGFPIRAYEVYVGEINGDGQPDFKIRFWDYQFGIEQSVIGPSVQKTSNLSLEQQKLSTSSTAISTANEIIGLQSLSYASLLQSRLVGSSVTKQNIDGNISQKPLPSTDVLELYSRSSSYLASYNDSLCGFNNCMPWRKIKSSLYWGDTNGDGKRDILIRPASVFENGFQGKLPSFIISSSTGSNSYVPDVLSVIKEDLFGRSLQEFSGTALKDVNDDGLSDIVIWTNPNSDVGALYSPGQRDGIFRSVLSLISDGSPSELARCRDVVKVPQNNSGHFMNEACNTAFVRAPEEGYTFVNKVRHHPNLGMCKSIQDAKRESSLATEQIATLNQEVLDITEKLLDSPEYERLKAENTLAQAEVPAFERKKENAESDFQAAQDFLILVEDEFEDGFVDELELAQEELEDARVRLENATFTYLLVVERAEEAEAKLQAYIQSKEDRLNQIEHLVRQLFQLNEDRRRLVEDLNRLEGGTIEFSLNTFWDESIMAYTQTNKHLPRWKYTKMPIVSGRLMSGLTSDAADQSGILWTRLLDAKNQENFRNDDRYGAAAEPDVDDVSTSNFFDQQVAEPGQDRYYAEVSMTLGALCDHYPNGPTSAIPHSVEQLPATLAFTLRQNYQVKTESGYRLTFNLSYVGKELFDFVKQNSDPYIWFKDAYIYHYLIRRHTSSFFINYYSVNSEKILNYINSIDESKWFNIKFLDDEISLAEQERIRTNLKGKLIDNVLSAITTRYIRRNNPWVLSRTGKFPMSRNVIISIRQLQRFIVANDHWRTEESFLPRFATYSQFTSYRSPDHSDNDRDGLTAIEELKRGLNPNNRDTDGDGMDDGYEVRNGLSALDRNDALKDHDGDGFNNAQEYQAGSDPFDPSDNPLSRDKQKQIASWLIPVISVTLF